MKIKEIERKMENYMEKENEIKETIEFKGLCIIQQAINEQS